MNAGPWLPVPPPDYGGIENVVATLVPELRARGHRVVLATVGASTIEADEIVSVYDEGRFAEITAPYTATMGIAHAHMAAVLDRLSGGDVDLVHDHVEVVGPALLAAAGTAVPPVLQTLHWDLAKHPEFYSRFDGRGRIFFAGVSRSQLARAHPVLRQQALGAVHLATPLPPRPDPDQPPGRHLLGLGRLTPVKGYDLAARLGLELVLAGPVAGAAGPAELESAPPDRPDVRYFQAEVAPHLGGGVRWVGSVGGAEKEQLLRTARAVVFPLRWDEPGGTAVVEALAAGVPVVAMRRGVLPELVVHGVTGWLADDEDEFAAYLLRVDELDRRACRDVAERLFAPPVMAARYEAFYRHIVAVARRSSPQQTPHQTLLDTATG
jgi:glycosyltransferase involved in cell wall biosynthesis